MDKVKSKTNNKESRTRKIAGTPLKDAGKNFLKTKSAQFRKINKAWDCSVLCLLHSGPRIYNGPL